MIQHVLEGEKILSGNNIDDFGKLLNSAWLTKKKLSSNISNPKIDQIYEYMISKGALVVNYLEPEVEDFYYFI